MILLILNFAVAELMWGERAQRSCFDYDKSSKNLTQVNRSRCKGVEVYYVRYKDGRVGTKRVISKKMKKKKVNLNAGFSWSQCQDSHGVTVPFHENGVFKPECMPDTLYSWQPCNRVKDLEEYSNEDEVLPLSESLGYLYAWRTPVSTSTYNGGQCSLRIKLKPGTRAIRTTSVADRNCFNHPDAMRGDVIIVNYWGGHEYIICNSKVVHSWSTGTREHIQEMKDDREWVMSHEVSEFDSFYKYDSDCYEKTNPSSFDSAVSNIEMFLGLVKGGVYLSPGATRQEHFQTKDPNYFNPRGAK